MTLILIILSALAGGFMLLLIHLYNTVVLIPRNLRSKLENQGIRGPSPSILLGNIPEIIKDTRNQNPSQSTSTHKFRHDWSSTLFSRLHNWRNAYGPVFMYSIGSTQFLCITDMDMVKEFSLSTSLSLGKPSYLSKGYGPMFGLGILASSGSIWAHQRKIIAPQFYLDKIKGMVNLMVDATSSKLKSWESRMQTDGGTADVTVDEDLRSLSADIISRACFGSNYSEGKEIFSKLRNVQKLISIAVIGIPGFRYLPTKSNKAIWRLVKEIDIEILEVVHQRSGGQYVEDLLQMLIEGAQTSKMSRNKFIVDNCKNIYFAGHETTALTASWSLMLLAAYPEWQERVRAEVQDICKGGLPNSDMLRSMKTLTMVIQEALRLYPPATFLIRDTLEDVKFKDIVIPKGVNIQIPVAMLQQDVHLWGSDAHEFNPERFANGIIGACKFPQAYIPFGAGPRTCLGQHFALTEVKVIVAMILSKFSFSISSKYHHSPAFRMVLEPRFGVCLHMRKL